MFQEKGDLNKTSFVFSIDHHVSCQFFKAIFFKSYVSSSPTLPQENCHSSGGIILSKVLTLERIRLTEK